MVFIWGSSKQTPISSLFAFPKTVKFMVLFKINSKLWFSHKIMKHFQPSSGYFSLLCKCIIEMPTVDVTQWSAKGLISFEAFENWNYISMKTVLPDINSKFRTIIWRHIMLLVMIYNLEVCLISGNLRDHNILYSVRILLPFHIVNKKILEKLPPDICIMIHLKKWASQN